MENNQSITLVAIAAIVIAGGALWYLLQTPATLVTNTPGGATTTTSVGGGTGTVGEEGCTNCLSEADSGKTIAFSSGTIITIILPDTYSKAALALSPPTGLTVNSGVAAPAGMWAASFTTSNPGTTSITIPGASRNTAPFALTIITTDAAHAWENGMVVVQKEDTNQTINLGLHDRFILMLGSDLNWTVKFDPVGSITRVPNSTSTGGIQGIYETQQSGTATLNAIGAPICKAGEACPQFLINITVHFDIGNTSSGM